MLKSILDWCQGTPTPPHFSKSTRKEYKVKGEARVTHWPRGPRNIAPFRKATLSAMPWALVLRETCGQAKYSPSLNHSPHPLHTSPLLPLGSAPSTSDSAIDTQTSTYCSLTWFISQHFPSLRLSWAVPVTLLCQPTRPSVHPIHTGASPPSSPPTRSQTRSQTNWWNWDNSEMGSKKKKKKWNGLKLLPTLPCLVFCQEIPPWLQPTKVRLFGVLIILMWAQSCLCFALLNAIIFISFVPILLPHLSNLWIHIPQIWKGESHIYLKDCIYGMNWEMTSDKQMAT